MGELEFDKYYVVAAAFAAILIVAALLLFNYLLAQWETPAELVQLTQCQQSPNCGMSPAVMFPQFWAAMIVSIALFAVPGMTLIYVIARRMTTDITHDIVRETDDDGVPYYRCRKCGKVRYSFTALTEDDCIDA